MLQSNTDEWLNNDVLLRTVEKVIEKECGTCRRIRVFWCHVAG